MAVVIGRLLLSVTVKLNSPIKCQDSTFGVHGK